MKPRPMPILYAIDTNSLWQHVPASPLSSGPAWSLYSAGWV